MKATRLTTSSRVAPRTRALLGLTIFVVNSLLLAAPFGGWARIREYYNNEAESRRLGTPKCFVCNAPATPVQYRGDDGESRMFYLCDKHKDKVPRIETVPWDLSSASSGLRSMFCLAAFQIVIPLAMLWLLWSTRAAPIDLVRKTQFSLQWASILLTLIGAVLTSW